jgi:hypothetical protein
VLHNQGLRAVGTVGTAEQLACSLSQPQLLSGLRIGGSAVDGDAAAGADGDWLPHSLTESRELT